MPTGALAVELAKFTAGMNTGWREKQGKQASGFFIFIPRLLIGMHFLALIHILIPALIAKNLIVLSIARQVQSKKKKME